MHQFTSDDLQGLIELRFLCACHVYCIQLALICNLILTLLIMIPSWFAADSASWVRSLVVLASLPNYPTHPPVHSPAPDPIHGLAAPPGAHSSALAPSPFPELVPGPAPVLHSLAAARLQTICLGDCSKFRFTRNYSALCIRNLHACVSNKDFKYLHRGIFPIN